MSRSKPDAKAHPKAKAAPTRHPAKPAVRAKLTRPAPANPTPLAPPPRPLTLAEVGRKLAKIDSDWAPTLRAPVAAAPRMSLPDAALRIVKDLDDPNEARRLRAIEQLADLGATSAVPKLKALLSDPSPPVGAAAAMALLKLGYKPMLDEMVARLSDPSPKVVAGTLTALGLSGRRELAQPIIQAFRTHSAVVGAAAASALGRLGDRLAVPPLLDALKVAFVAAEVCEALGRLGDPAAAPALVRALSSPHPAVRASAARALGTFKGDSRRLDEKLALKVVAGLHRLLEDKVKRVRASAALSLVELGVRTAGAQLVEILREA